MIVTIIVENGIVQGVYVDDPRELRVVIVDYDTERVDEGRLAILDEETEEAARVFELPVGPASALLPKIADVVTHQLKGDGEES